MFSLTDYEWLSTSQIVSLRGRSYAHGPQRRAAARRDDRREPAPDRRALRRPRGAGRPPPGLPRHVRELWEQVDGGRARFMARGVETGRPRRHLGAQPLRVGRAPVRHRAGRRDPRHHQSRLQGGRARVRARPRRASSCSFMARGFRGADYVAMLDEVRAAARTARDDRARGRLGRASWPTARRVSDGELAAREAALQFDDPINIQYTSGTTGLAQGRDALAPQHPQQRLLRRPRRWATRERDRVCVPVPFYHCFGMVIGNLGCTTHGACMVVPGESFDAGAVLEAVEAERCTSLYGVPTMFIARARAPGLRRASTCPACAPASWPARRARSR